MPMYAVHRTPWHKQDLADLRSQVPSEAEFGSVVFDVELGGYMTKRKWNKFAGLITSAFKLIEYEGSFNITVSVPALNVDSYGDNETVMNRLGKLKGVMNAMAPVPAFWSWTVVMQFDKFPYWNQVEDYMQTVERAIYGKRFSEIEREKRASITRIRPTG